MDFGKYQEELKKRAAQKPKGMHSYAHDITRQVTEWVGETHAFGKWLGITLRIGPGRMKDLLAQMKKNSNHSAKYLMTCVKTKQKSTQ